MTSRSAPVHWLMQRVSDLPVETSWLAEWERGYAADLSHEKRRADWLLGRWTMKRAIVAGWSAPHAAPAAAEIEIRAAADGAPEPMLAGRRLPGAISLSHRAGRAVCALAPAGVELGCDLELLEPRSRAFVGDFLSAREARRCARASGPESVVLPNLLWSARESVLKALRLGLTVDTRRVGVHVGECLDGDDWSPFEAEFRESSMAPPASFAGWWRRVAGCVVTMASRPGSSAPHGLTP